MPNHLDRPTSLFRPTPTPTRTHAKGTRRNVRAGRMRDGGTVTGPAHRSRIDPCRGRPALRRITGRQTGLVFDQQKNREADVLAVSRSVLGSPSPTHPKDGR